jgi:ketosteroid isomerase-like protein
MSEQELQTVLEFFGDVSEGGELDMVALTNDEELWAQNDDRVIETVRIRFVVPEEGGVQVMGQDFEGISGFREGWRTWLEPWDRYIVHVDEMIDSERGKILMLVSSRARMRGTNTEVPQSSAALFHLADGKIVEIGFYLDQEHARRDAGLT